MDVVGSRVCSICAKRMTGWYNRYRFVHKKRYCETCMMTNVYFKGMYIAPYKFPYPSVLVYHIEKTEYDLQW